MSNISFGLPKPDKRSDEEKVADTLMEKIERHPEVRVYVNGMVYRENFDYVIKNGKVAFHTAPSPGDFVQIYDHSNDELGVSSIEYDV